MKASAVRSARRLSEAGGLLALSVLLDSAVEHYRGSFKNRAMLTPLLVSALELLVALHARGDTRAANHRLRQGIAAAAALTGVAGTGFHLYNILKRPGRLSWQNLFYGAPLGAPSALLLSGLFSAAAEEVRDGQAGRRPRVFGRPAGRVLGVVSALGLIGSAAEAALLHFRGAFHNPAMVAPVALPPATGVLLLHTATTPGRAHGSLTRWCLRATAALGFVGTAFHAWGVHRNIGGWRNWRQNVLNGPPLPAPPSFTALAIAGLAALALLGERRG